MTKHEVYNSFKVLSDYIDEHFDSLSVAQFKELQRLSVTAWDILRPRAGERRGV